MEVYKTTTTNTTITNDKETRKMDDPLSQLDKNQIFELILEQIGGFGRFQKVIWIIGLISSFLGLTNIMNIYAGTATFVDVITFLFTV